MLLVQSHLSSILQYAQRYSLSFNTFYQLQVFNLVNEVYNICGWGQDVYGDGIVFDQLEHLKLCICKDDSSNVLARFLKDSPNLRVLVISQLDVSFFGLTISKQI